MKNITNSQRLQRSVARYLVLSETYGKGFVAACLYNVLVNTFGSKPVEKAIAAARHEIFMAKLSPVQKANYGKMFAK